MERVLEKSAILGKSTKSTSSRGSSHVFEPGMKVSIENFPGKLFLVTSEHETKFSMKRYTVGITDRQIIEFVSEKYNPVLMTALDCSMMESLVKVKFNRGCIIAFHFRNGVVKTFFMFECVECVHTIKNIMSQSGKCAAHLAQKDSLKMVNAQCLLELVRNLEDEFSLNPSHALVTILMDRLRETVECFGEANDPRYQEVIAHIQIFLQRVDVIAVLDPPLPQPPAVTAVIRNMDTLSSPRQRSSGVEVLLSSGKGSCRRKKEVSRVAFDESSAALARDLAVMMQSWSEHDVDDDQLEVELETQVLNAALNRAPGAGALLNRNPKRDTIELNELNDMLGNMSAELESIVGHDDAPRRLTMTSRTSSMESYDADFESLLAPLQQDDEAGVTYES